MECWEHMVGMVLEMLTIGMVTQEQAESWLWYLVEFAEVTYV